MFSVAITILFHHMFLLNIVEVVAGEFQAGIAVDYTQPSDDHSHGEYLPTVGGHAVFACCSVITFLIIQ